MQIQNYAHAHTATVATVVTNVRNCCVFYWPMFTIPHDRPYKQNKHWKVLAFVHFSERTHTHTHRYTITVRANEDTTIFSGATPKPTQSSFRASVRKSKFDFPFSAATLGQMDRPWFSIFSFSLLVGFKSTCKQIEIVKLIRNGKWRGLNWR